MEDKTRQKHEAHTKEQMNINPAIQSFITSITAHHPRPILRATITATMRGLAQCQIEFDGSTSINGRLSVIISDDEREGTWQLLSEHFRDNR